MTNKEKLAKVRAEIERLIDRKDPNTYLGISKIEAYKDVLSFIDSIQEEPKECMYSKDNYTDEDRKALCDGCEEECEFNKKEGPVSEIDFEQELYKYFGQVKDFTLGMRIAKRFYEIGRNYQESVSEEQVKELLISKHDDKTCKENGDYLTQEPISDDLEEAIEQYCVKHGYISIVDGYYTLQEKVSDIARHFANWQKQKETLSLTIEDIKTIDRLLNRCVDCNNPYKEVLKQFKDLKK